MGCTVNSFWGMSLPVATVVICWYSAVVSILESTLFIVGLVRLDSILRLTIHTPGHTNPSEIDISTAKLVVSAILGIRLAISVLDSIASALAIYGARKSSHLLILPWLVESAIILALTLIGYCTYIVMVISAVGFPFLLLIFWGIHCWAWVAVFSHYQAIRQNLKTSSNYKLFDNGANGEIKA